jgi:hypothetical protein
MSIAQIIMAGVVVNVIAVDPAAVISSDGLKITWPGGEFDAPAGSKFMAQAGAGIGWTLVSGVLIAPPAPPAPPPSVPASVTRRQFFQAAAQDSLITQAEALAVFATGAIPAALATAITALPAAQQFAAKLAILGGSSFERANPLVAALGAGMGQTPAQIDALFILAATL